MDEQKKADGQAAQAQPAEVLDETVEVTATDGAVEEVDVAGVAEEVPAGEAPTPQGPEAAADAEAPAPPAPEAAAGTEPPAPPAPGSDASPASVPEPPAAPAGQPSATGALVCGILAIVFSGFPIVGIALGIIAIVLAGKYFKAGGTQGTGKAGRICGIIGIVLAVVWFIAGLVIGMQALNLLQDQSSTSSSLIEETMDASEESKAAAEAVTMRLQALKDRDPQAIAAAAAIVEESFEDGIGYTMEECGIDIDEYMDLVLTDFDYHLVTFAEDTDSNGTEAEAEFIVTCANVSKASISATSIITEASTDGTIDSMGSLEEARLWLGDVIMDSLADAGTTNSAWFDIDMQNEDGVWVVDEDSWDEEIAFYFCFA